MDRASEYRRQIVREAKAHAVSAEYHRHQDMWLGLTMTTVATLVTTGIFASLLSQLKLDERTWQLPTTGWLLVVFIGAALLSIAAPILTSLHTRLHDAADAASHGASASRLDGVVSELDIFLLRYPAESALTDRNKALDELKTIMATCSQIRSTSISMPIQSYDAADRELMKETGADAAPADEGLIHRVGALIARLASGENATKQHIEKLNGQIAEMEQKRDAEAVNFFESHVSDQLIFRRADGTLIRKKGPDGFIVALSKANPCRSRRASDISVKLLDNHALVTLVVTTTRQDGSIGRYRNIRAFSRFGDNWILELWYNYEITGATSN